MYQDLSTHHNWPVKKAVVNLPVRFKKIRNELPLIIVESIGGQNKDIGTTLQILLTRVRLHYQHRLGC